MSQKPLLQVDVFTDRAMMGNPVAVIFDADDLTAAQMQAIARWTNLSETTFVCAPTDPRADYWVRIFTPNRELPFAGHPSIGTAHAVLEHSSMALGERDSSRTILHMQCGAGVLRLSVDGVDAQRKIFVQAPRAQLHALSHADTALIENALGAAPMRDSKSPPQLVNVGPTWLIWDLKTASRVRTLEPNQASLAPILARNQAIGITVFGREATGDAALAVRSFCPNDGIVEDPVCGSGNASVAAYLHHHQALTDIGHAYVASQGREVGRDGKVHVRIDDGGQIEIGGHSVTCIRGQLDLSSL